jgi:predicted DNA-binding transcriptional regulator AlpA
MSEISGLLRLKQVLKLIPVSAATWWRGIKDGRYPKPVKLGPRMTCWLTSDIQALIDRLAQGVDLDGPNGVSQ